MRKFWKPKLPLELLFHEHVAFLYFQKMMLKGNIVQVRD